MERYVITKLGFGSLPGPMSLHNMDLLLTSSLSWQSWGYTGQEKYPSRLTLFPPFPGRETMLTLGSDQVRPPRPPTATPTAQVSVIGKVFIDKTILPFMPRPPNPKHSQKPLTPRLVLHQEPKHFHESSQTPIVCVLFTNSVPGFFSGFWSIIVPCVLFMTQGITQSMLGTSTLQGLQRATFFQLWLNYCSDKSNPKSTRGTPQDRCYPLVTIRKFRNKRWLTDASVSLPKSRCGNLKW